MAILTRRALQSLIDDGPVLPGSMSRLVDRLNLGTKDSLEAEWELIILSALSRVGLVQYEPDLGGTAKLDFHFRDPSQLVVTGDITTISDDDANRRNPVDHLVRELSRRTSERRLEGSFTIGISSEIRGKQSHKNEVLLRLPSPDRFKHYIFDAQFEAFLERVASAPGSPHQHRVDNEEASLLIGYNPGKQGLSTVHYANYKSPRDIVRNTLYNRLKKKVDQIKKAGPLADMGFRGVLICDGGSSVFQPTLGVGVHGFEQIAQHFLRKTRSIDFIASITVWDPLSVQASRDKRYKFDVRIVEGRDCGVASTFGAVLRHGLLQLPQPTRTPINAKSHLEWYASHGTTALSYGDQLGGTLSHGELTLSSRAVVDYLTGRIDRCEFEVLVGDLGLSILRRDIDAGGLVDSVELLHRHEHDDDELVFRWRTRDVSVAPFVRPRGSDSSQGN